MSTRASATIASFALLLLTACPVSEDAPPPADHVKAVVLPFMTLTPFHIAAEEGFFAEQNLDVEFVMLGRGREVMTALARGDVDAYGGMLTINELALVAGGARVRMIASLGRLSPEHCSHASFLVRREHLESGALQDRERVKQLRFDVDVLVPFGFWTDELLRPLDLAVGDLEIVDLPPPAALAAMGDGSIDVTVSSEPWVTRIRESAGAAVWKPVSELVPEYVLTMLMYGPTLIDERPEVGKRFAVAMLKAIRKFNEGKTPRNLDIVERATGLDRELVAATCWAPIRDDARLDPTLFHDYQAWNVARGLVDRVLADEELFDPSFIDHANDVLEGSR